jgi:hypothetical protein
MVKRFTELLLGCQLHQEWVKSHHFRDIVRVILIGKRLRRIIQQRKEIGDVQRSIHTVTRYYVQQRVGVPNLTALLVHQQCWWSDTHQQVAASDCIKCDNGTEHVTKMWVFNPTLMVLTACEQLCEFVFVIKVQITSVQEYMLRFCTLWR